MDFVVVLLVLIVAMFFLASRKQKKEAQKVQSLQDSLAVGDDVMTTSGMHGVITDLDEDTIDLEIAPDVITTWNRLAIRQRVVVDGSEYTDDEFDDDPNAAHDDGTGYEDATSQVEATEHPNGARPRLTKE